MFTLKKNFKNLIKKNVHLEHFYHYLILRIFYNKFSNYPFGNKLKFNKNDYIKKFNFSKTKKYIEVEKLENLSGFKIDEDWLNELALVTQVSIKNSEICYAHGRVIYSILSKYLSMNNYNDISIIETGTSKGFSSLCMSKALLDNNLSGKILTIDIIPHSKRMYWNSISDFEGKKTRYELLIRWSDLIKKYISYIDGTSKKIFKNLKINRVHFAFLDGSHTYHDVFNEFQFVAKRQQKGDIIIVDDYNRQYKGLIIASDKLSNKYNYSKSVINGDINRSYLVCQKNN